MMAPCFSAAPPDREAPDIAVHGKDAVGDEQFAPGRRGKFRQDLFGRRHILVREDVNPGPGEPAAIDDAGVVQLVGDDMVLRTEEAETVPALAAKPD